MTVADNIAGLSLKFSRHRGSFRITPLVLASLFVLGFLMFTLSPRVNRNPVLLTSFLLTTTFLLGLLVVVYCDVLRRRRTLSYEITPRNVHYIQLTMQSCIYLYWAHYWHEVYNQFPLISAQIVFAYALDMLVCWMRRDRWTFGFGPFPIVLSTNLFLWFKDDWFLLQFLMIASAVLGKEFLKWHRDGRMTHIFNPSAFALFIFSVILLITRSTNSVSWGQEIALTISAPPNIYLEIFVVGLIVQALFAVTLVTLSAATMLYLLNVLYTNVTGGYHFIDSNIPVLVFLGLHLLVTDPATSPRTAVGRVLFGSLYGIAVFITFGFLGWLSAPRFYEKILCVPVLNLSVPALDRAGLSLQNKLAIPSLFANWNPRQLNLFHMALWVSLFIVMMATGFLGNVHPGRDLDFWRRACAEGNWDGCVTWARTIGGIS